MAKLTRVFQKIFGVNSPNTGQFGSAQLGTKELTSDPAEIQALAAWTDGWTGAVISPQALPTYEEDQGIHLVETYQLAYLFQEGIPEWDSLTTYFQNSVVKLAGTYEIYGSLTNNNIGNALTDTTNWTFLQNLQRDISISMGLESSPSGRRLAMNGTTIAKISGGTVNGAQYFRAYDYLWTNVLDTYAPVAGGRGVSSLADFNANKTITRTDFTNMSPMQVGSIVNSAGRNNIGAATVSSAGSVSGTISINSVTLSASNIPTITGKVNASTGTGAAVSDAGTGASVSGGELSNPGTNTKATLTTTSTNTGGSAFTPTGSLSASYSGSVSSVVHPVFGVYYYINY